MGGGATLQRALAPPGEWPPLRVCGFISRGVPRGNPRVNPGCTAPRVRKEHTGGNRNTMVSHAPPPVAKFGSRSPENPFLLDKVSLVLTRSAALHKGAMTDDALPAPEWPLANEGTLSDYVFPPAGGMVRRSVFSNADPSAKVDLSTKASLAIFVNATGIPEVANQFAECIGAESADDLFHNPRDMWDNLTRETLLTRKIPQEFGEEFEEERQLTGVEVGKLNKGRDALHVASPC